MFKKQKSTQNKIKAMTLGISGSFSEFQPHTSFLNKWSTSGVQAPPPNPQPEFPLLPGQDRES